jgi:hypothetical protein
MNHAQGKILGYGTIRKGTKSYRNALRHCRKMKRIYGVEFDYSELWNLDCTFMDFVYRKGYIKVKLSDKLFNYSYEDYEELKNEQIEIIRNVQNQEMCDFLLPRLKEFRHTTHGYPGWCENENEWDVYIGDCIREIEEQHTINKFLDKINSFWD